MTIIYVRNKPVRIPDKPMALDSRRARDERDDSDDGDEVGMPLLAAAAHFKAVRKGSSTLNPGLLRQLLKASLAALDGDEDAEDEAEPGALGETRVRQATLPRGLGQSPAESSVTSRGDSRRRAHDTALGADGFDMDALMQRTR